MWHVKRPVQPYESCRRLLLRRSQTGLWSCPRRCHGKIGIVATSGERSSHSSASSVLGRNSRVISGSDRRQLVQPRRIDVAETWAQGGSLDVACLSTGLYSTTAAPFKPTLPPLLCSLPSAPSSPRLALHWTVCSMPRCSKLWLSYHKGISSLWLQRAICSNALKSVPWIQRYGGEAPEVRWRSSGAGHSDQ